MHNVMCLVNGKQLFVMVAESEADIKQLEVLVRETKLICRMCKNTGLWIVEEWFPGTKEVVVMSLRKKLELTDADRQVLASELSNH